MEPMPLPGQVPEGYQEDPGGEPAWYNRLWSGTYGMATSVIAPVANGAVSAWNYPYCSKASEAAVSGVLNLGDWMSGIPSEQQARYENGIREWLGGPELISACNVIAHQTTDLLLHFTRHTPHYVRESPHWAAEALRDPKGKRTPLGRLISAIDRQCKLALLRDGNSTMILSQGYNAASRIYSRAIDTSSQVYDPHFTLKLVKRSIREANEHFARTASVLKRYPQVSSPLVMRALWQEHLHPALPVDARLTPGTERQQALSWYFRPLADRLLSITNPEGSSSMLVPVGFKGILWDVMRQTAIPGSIHQILNELMDPLNIDTTLLKLLEAEPAEASTFEPPRDRHQEELEELCIDLTGHLVATFSPRLNTVLHLIPNLRRKLGTALAAQMRQVALSGTDLGNSINRALREGLPSFCPGQWEGEGANLRYVPRGEEGEEFHFTFPKDHAERVAEADRLDRERHAVRARLVTKLDEMLQLHIRKTLPEAIQASLQRGWQSPDEWIEAYLGRGLLAFKRFLAKGAHLLVVHVIGNIAKILFFPLIHVGDKLISRMSRSVSERAVERLHLDIHKNLVYRVIDVAVELLELPSVGHELVVT